MPKQSAPLFTLTTQATTALVQDCFITVAGAQAAADGNALGVVRQNANIGDYVPVDVLGTTIVQAGAAISKGATVKSDASGRAITWATSGAKLGTALQAASSAGQLIEVLLIQNVA